MLMLDKNIYINFDYMIDTVIQQAKLINKKEYKVGIFVSNNESKFLFYAQSVLKNYKFKLDSQIILFEAAYLSNHFKFQDNYDKYDFIIVEEVLENQLINKNQVVYFNTSIMQSVINKPFIGVIQYQIKEQANFVKHEYLYFKWPQYFINQYQIKE